MTLALFVALAGMAPAARASTYDPLSVPGSDAAARRDGDGPRSVLEPRDRWQRK